jgi:hypothetical protein
MSKELRIRRNNVELSFHFETVEELTKQLQNNNEIWQVIEGNLDISFLEKKTIREDLIDICELDGSLIVLKKSPASPLHKVILTLYAYGPNGATVDQISRTTGIEKPSNQILTPGKNKKYFRKLENKKWYLSDKGLEITPKIINGLKK